MTAIDKVAMEVTVGADPLSTDPTDYINLKFGFQVALQHRGNRIWKNYARSDPYWKLFNAIIWDSSGNCAIEISTDLSLNDLKKIKDWITGILDEVDETSIVNDPGSGISSSED